MGYLKLLILPLLLINLNVIGQIEMLGNNTSIYIPSNGAIISPEGVTVSNGATIDNHGMFITRDTSLINRLDVFSNCSNGLLIINSNDTILISNIMLDSCNNIILTSKSKIIFTDGTKINVGSNLKAYIK